MKLRAFLKQRCHQWTASTRQRMGQGVYAVLQDSHSCWMPRGNLYVEHDIGNKLVRYPDGKRRAVRVTKVRDTGGATFLSLAADTPLLS